MSELPKVKVKVEDAMKQEFREGSKTAPAVDVAVAGLRAQFSYADLRRITFELLEHLSPRIPAEEAAPRPLPLDKPAYPRETPGFGE